MKTSLDKTGRVVIPKKLREMANLDPGVKFEIEVQGEEIILKPIGEELTLLKKGGVLITQGEIMGDAKSISPRISPDAALRLIKENLKSFRIVEMNKDDYFKLLELMAGHLCVGGSIYDGIIGYAGRNEGFG